MRAISIILIILCGICGVFSAQSQRSQDVPYSISVDAAQVSVDFTVKDSMGKAITDLNQYDIEILDNGEPRKIQTFSPVKTPFHMVLLLDCSESVRDRLSLLVISLARFADQLRPQDKIAIAVFGTDIEEVVDFGAKGKPFNIPDSPMCHGTNFYNALDWAQKKLRGVSGRRGALVFTDGRESDVPRKEVTVDGNKVRRVVPPEDDREFQKVLKRARELGAPFYFVAVDTDLNPGTDYGGPVPDLQQFRARLTRMASETGGSVTYPEEARDVLNFYLQITRDLGTSYSAGFTPAKSRDGKPHRIEIRVRGEEDYRVKQSRDSYIIN